MLFIGYLYFYFKLTLKKFIVDLFVHPRLSEFHFLTSFEIVKLNVHAKVCILRCVAFTSFLTKTSLTVVVMQLKIKIVIFLISTKHNPTTNDKF